VLLGLGLTNIYIRATWHEVEDGVLWVVRPDGVTAAELADRAPAAKAGVRLGDVLLAIDGRPVESPADVVVSAHAAVETTSLTYTLLRLGSREIVQVRLAPIPRATASCISSSRRSASSR